MGLRSPSYLLGLAILFLVPCYWHPRIASADLGSHLYNAWLVNEIQGGRIAGIDIATQWHNVLFDWLLASLLPRMGADWTQRLAVSIGVLTFAGGATMLVCVTAGRLPWHVIPALMMLAYGFVFHVGLFNFYMSCGFCLAALALLWNGAGRRPALVIPLLVLAVTAHLLPVIWLGAVLGFVRLANTLKLRSRWLLTLGSALGILGAGYLIRRAILHRWDPSQLYLWSGADQAIIFDLPYVKMGAAWLAWGALMTLWLVIEVGWSGIWNSSLPNLILLQAVGLAYIPTHLQLPGFSAHFSLLAERLSLLQGVLVCCLVSRLPSPGLALIPGLALGLFYFGSLYVDDGRVIRFEEEVMATTAKFSGLPRVVSGLCDPKGRMNYAYHLLDRACVGRCYSYTNYEPSSGQFRLRARAGNTVVVSDIKRAYAYELDGTEVQSDEVPLLRVEGRVGGAVTVRQLQPGERLGPPCPSVP